MKINLFKYFSLILCLIFFSCNEIRQIDRTIKKTFAQVNKIDRKKERYSNQLGINNDKEDSDSSNNNFNQVNPIEQKNLINEHGFLFEIINGVDPGKIVSIKTDDGSQNLFVVNNLDSISVNKNIEVFGWHPYWMGDTWEKYPFELLSTVSFFSYKIDPKSGLPQNDDELKIWKESSFVEVAKSKRTKVLLTVSLHGKNNITDFFNSGSANYNNLFRSVSNLILIKDADGIDLNFENLPSKYSSKFSEFVKEFHQFLSKEFDKKNKISPFISITIPPSQISENYNLNELDQYADLFVIMGYDLHSKVDPSPTSPLQSESNEFDLQSIINRFDKYGLDKSKSILALPYYGLMYSIDKKNDSIGSEDEFKYSLDTKLTYSEINKLFLENQNIKYNNVLDPLSMTKQISVIFDDSSMKEVYYDDDYTLSKKYSYAISQGLKGVGIWALGFDSDRNELWNLIEDKFSTNEIIFDDPIAEINGFPIRFAKSLIKDKNVYVTIILFFTFSVVIAILILLNDPKFRERITEKRINSLILLTLLYIFLLPLVDFVRDLFYMRGYGFYLDSELNIYIAAFLGALFFYLGSKITLKKEERP